VTRRCWAWRRHHSSVQRLEDLLEAAHEKGYRVHDDVDVVVTMTIQFIGMLVRKQSSARRGIDLDGFLKQIEQVMSEWLRRSSEAPERPLTVGPHLRMKDHEQLTKASDTQLSSVDDRGVPRAPAE